MRLFSSLALIPTLAGCGLLLGVDPSPQDAGVLPDGSPPDTRVMDADPEDTSLPDASVDGIVRDARVDGSMMSDAMMVDVGVSCPPVPIGSSVVAYWDFEDRSDTATFPDVVGGNYGRLVGAAPPRDVMGPGDCGNAIAFAFSPEPSYVLAAASDDFELPSGSIELGVKVPAHQAFGILSRDQSGADTPGHFGIFVTDGGHIAARIQSTTGQTWACGDVPAPIGVWIHVAVNWGPGGFELWIDDTLQTRTGMLAYTDGIPRPITCGGTSTNGIDGNGLPFYFGVSSALNPGSRGLTVPFVNGAIDDVILRDDRWAPSL